MKLKADILHHFPRIQMFHFQHDRRIWRHHAVFLRVFVNDTSYHHVDDIVLRAVFRYQRTYISTVSHNRYSVGNHFDFIHTMGYVYDTKLLFP